ncbi:hypothetical protein [Kineococcus aurantiacus]|uniref:Lipoprotein n=1 Tax=Kineococcus aurantiacus TaxID=37633 RepID=A0A7Y9DL27_9ACTN|nr:hypothetical protein [Kineococcus aurantiacus]NYD22587.1 hypothetical protein [Kineococcus aurantiacus]
MRTASQLALAAACLPLLLTGCTSTAQADADADARAADVGRSLDRTASGSGDLDDVVGFALRDGQGATWPAVELLEVAPGPGGTVEGTVVEVRVTGYGAPGGGRGFDLGPDQAPSTRNCYRYVLRPWGVDVHPSTGEPLAERIDRGCEQREVIDVPEPPPVPHLTDADTEALRAALDRPGAAAVRAALDAAPRPGVRVDVGVHDGWVGAALSAAPRGSGCVLGRRGPDGQVQVWVPPAVLVQPGESSCDAWTAAAGGAVVPPH